MSKKASIGSIFNTFLLMLLGIALTPTVESTVTTQLVNLTGPAAAIADLIPLIWIFLVIGIGAAAVYNQFKGM